MEVQAKNCANLDHSEIKANIYCSKCEIYMCNKCENIHSKLFNNHQSYIIEKNIEQIITGLCKEENHHMELQFYCKTHGQSCCAWESIMIVKYVISKI